MFFLGAGGTHEFFAGGGIEEEVADDDFGAGGATFWGGGDDFAAVDDDFHALHGFVAAGTEGEFGDGGDAGDGFAAEAESDDIEDVVVIIYLAGGVGLDAQQRVVLIHAAAVVGDGDGLEPGLFDADGDLVGAGVDGVFDELLDDGGGAFDDLAGGDLIADVFW